MNVLAATGRFALFCGSVFGVLFRRPPKGEVARVAFEMGFAALPILLVIGAFVGTNLSLQGFYAFQPLGGQDLVGMFVGLAGVRELAPIIASAMIAAKLGTEMASQLAVMRGGDQIDALEVMGVDPTWYLVAPRFWGMLLVMPALTIIATVTMLASAWAVAVHQLGLNGHTFLELAAQAAQPRDFLFGALKSVVFGDIICLVACWCGFEAERGPEGVGAATNRAVVTAAVVCVLLNYFFSELLYG